MPHGITRRDFLRYSAAAAGSLWFASLLDGQLPQADAATLQQGIAQEPSFQPLPPPTLLGAAVDINIGADGVHWLIDASGAPSTFDPILDEWLLFGGGIDAAAYIPDPNRNSEFGSVLCFFRGSEVFQAGTAGPVPLAQRWPQLPFSFQDGVDGAAYAGPQSFYLFRNGQAANLDLYGNVLAVSPLTSFNSNGWNWPDTWQGGTFDFVISGNGSEFPVNALFVRDGQYIVINLLSTAIIMSGLTPLNAQFQGAALALLNQGGLQACVCNGSVTATDVPLQAFGGPLVYSLQNAQSPDPAQVTYIAQQSSGWPQSWHPLLRQAPAGSMGSLWGLTETGLVLVNDTVSWTPAPLPNNISAISLDVGTDGAVYAAGAGALYRFDSAGAGWVQAATTVLALEQVSVGDADHVWVRDTEGKVFRFNSSSGTLAQANLSAAATHISANADGTLWHCNNGQASIYRLISEGSAPSEVIPVGPDVTSVQKAASTSFGTGFFLTQNNSQSSLLRYVSAYLFKTGSQYFPAGSPRIAVGASSIFLFTETFTSSNVDFAIAALDAQTGAERWRYPYPNNAEIDGYSPIYDPKHQLVYFFQAIGVITALDAHTGSLRWSLQITPVIPVQPILADGMILITAWDNPLTSPNTMNAYVLAIDTDDAAQRAAGDETVVVCWQYSANIQGQNLDPMPPLYFEGSVYVIAWSSTPQGPNITILQVDAVTGAGAVTTNLTLEGSNIFQPTVAPMVGRANVYGTVVPVLFINAGTTIFAFPLDFNNPYFTSYTSQQLVASPSPTNLLLYAGALYFGDGNGLLYGLDENLALVPGLPYQFTSGSVITGLTVMPDSEGEAVIIAGDYAKNVLCFYSTASGQLLTLPTNQTGVGAMSEVTSDGIIYAGGSGTAQTGSLGQVFAIRASIVSALRDFVIESQLMQDYDAGAAAIARYQTHITIVDNNKTPMPFTGIKIWADQTLNVLVDGQAYTIGPDTPVSTEVDASGSLTIASDASDIFATTLRVWAAFMDPFERILIFPDQEFHARLPGMTADPTNDDPTVINLATGANYAGTQVFTDQKQAQSAADAISAVCKATGLGSSTAGATGGYPAATSPQDTTQRYAAYNDLTGIRYSPANTPAARVPSALTPYGMAWDQTGLVFKVFTTAQAAYWIDQLPGKSDDNTLLGGIGSWFSHLWDKVKSGFAKIGQAIVSVGKSIYVGIQYVVDGVTYVLRHVIRDITDLAALVGAFFVALGKEIEDIIQLLSLLLHFEEVVKTHNILKTAILGLISNLAADITNQDLPAVNAFFTNGEQAIRDAFCTVKQQIDASVTCNDALRAAVSGVGSPAVSSFGGSGSTAHTVFRVAPKNGGAPASHTVYATWSMDKVKHHYKQATTPSQTKTQTETQAADPITDFLNVFTASLTSNPALQKAFTDTKSDFAATFKVQSAAQFLEMAIVDLLDILQDLMISSLAVAQAFLSGPSGLLALAGDLVAFLFDPNSGLLTRPLNIPILSDLYQHFFSSELTFLDLMVLVASIPLTFLYRIIEGNWLSEQASMPAAGASLGLTPLARAAGLLNGIMYFGRVIFTPIADAAGTATGGANAILRPILVSLSAGIQFAALLGAPGSTANRVQWSANTGIIFAGFSGPVFAPATVSFLALTRCGAFIFEKADSTSDISWLQFSGDILGVIPAFARPIKYLAQTFPITATTLLIAIDVICNYGAAAVHIDLTAQNWDAAPTDLPPAPEPLPAGLEQLYMPFVTDNQ